jgi:hypothetical protein
VRELERRILTGPSCRRGSAGGGRSVSVMINAMKITFPSKTFHHNDVYTSYHDTMFDLAGA